MGLGYEFIQRSLVELNLVGAFGFRINICKRLM